MGDLRILRTSPSSPFALKGHPALIGHILLPLWFGWLHCFPVRCPNRCRTPFHWSHFNIIVYSCSKIRFSYKSPSNEVPILYRNKLHFGILHFSKDTLCTILAIGVDVGVLSSHWWLRRSGVHPMEKLTQTYVKTVDGSHPPLASNRVTEEGRLWIEKSALYAHTCLPSKFQIISKH